uniref:C-X-C motif chemokine n=1 Tax=Capra hircus TaxID=9925 RepID=A0A8C2N9W2_CAPHI
MTHKGRQGRDPRRMTTTFPLHGPLGRSSRGIPAIRNGRCSCINTSQGMIHPKSIKDLKQFAPSPTCEKIEIIATVKNGAQVCLNPDLPEVKELIKEWEKQVNQKKKQRKGKKYKKTKKVPKVKRSQRPSQKKTT